MIIDYKITLSRNEVIKLLVDSENVSTVTEEGERVILMGYGKSEIIIDNKKGGFGHQLLTNVDFVDQQEYQWSLIRLFTLDKLTYSGTISPVHR